MRSNEKQGARGAPRWVLLVAVAAVAIAGWAAFEGFRHIPPQRISRIPGPIGGPDVAQDVNTMIGQQARGFTLPDGENQIHTVTPGQRRTIVVISHMGLN
jgi:hypothetical protein